MRIAECRGARRAPERNWKSITYKILSLARFAAEFARKTQIFVKIQGQYMIGWLFSGL